MGICEEKVEVSDDSETEVLIPGLPDEIAEQCLVHLPFPSQTLARSVSRSWKKAFSNPNFLLSKKSLSLSLPYIFVHVSHKSTGYTRWQAFDPRSRSWFPLPPMPCSRKFSSPGSLASAALPREGRLFVLGGACTDNQSPLRTLVSYHAPTNSWSLASPMRTPRSFFAAAALGGKIIAAGGDPAASAECYDPAQNKWSPVSGMRAGIPRYDAATVGSKLYITEGWSWPFSFPPRGAVYDAEADRWEEMPGGLCDGWTGAGVVLGERLFVIREHGDRRLKVYEPKTDAWREVSGEGLPRQVRRPYTVTGAEGRIYAAGSGADVAVGRVAEDGRGGWKVEWDVVEGPAEFENFAPSNCEVLYA
ncbi:F-box protein AFR-like [Aristolochia californica]|uniref:F-box protein AFR-like n=1 Tax=Aristolochia californica TaxID=171875 RepID=UPI0035E0969F